MLRAARGEEVKTHSASFHRKGSLSKPYHNGEKFFFGGNGALPCGGGLQVVKGGFIRKKIRQK